MHPRVQQYLDVRRRGRGALVPLEGAWALERARSCGATIEAVFVCDGSRAVDLDIRCEVVVVGARVMRRLVDRDAPGEVCALARRPMVRSLDELGLGPSSMIVVADGLDLPGNLGTIVRCADGAGASAVVLCDSPVRVAHPTVVKASTGAVLRLPVLDVGRGEAIAWLRAAGVRVVAADPSATTSYRDADYGGGAAVAIVLGSERRGLAPGWRAAADELVSIPMLGVADSLNVGHAAALLLYEALHQQTTGT